MQKLPFGKVVSLSSFVKKGNTLVFLVRIPSCESCYTPVLDRLSALQHRLNVIVVVYSDLPQGTVYQDLWPYTTKLEKAFLSVGDSNHAATKLNDVRSMLLAVREDGQMRVVSTSLLWQDHIESRIAGIK